MSKYSSKAQKFISNKMHKMEGEDKPQAQKVAIAMSYARKEGFKVPKKKSKPDVHCADHSSMTNKDRRGANKTAASKKWSK